MTRLGNFLLGLILMLVLAVPAFATPPLSEDGEFSAELQAAMRRQDELADAGKLDLMVTEARKGADAGTPDALYLLGRALGNKALLAKSEGRPTEFMKYIEEAREAFATAKELGGLLYAPGFLGLARCARFEEDRAEAIRQLKQALRVSPGFKTASLELAQVLWEQGLYADAEFELRRLLENHPDDTDARMLLGGLQVKRKRWGDAEREFRAILSRDPENAAARKLLGTCLMFQEKDTEAAEHWEMARAADPQDDEPYITLFHLYRRLENEEQARVVLQALVTTLPDSEAANRARQTLEQMDADPEYFRGEKAVEGPEQLIAQVENGNDSERVRALQKMRDFEWDSLPGVVYKMLSPKEAAPSTRRAALQLIGVHGDPRTLPLVEILLFHPKEQDPELQVRRAAAQALERLPTEAAVPLLMRLLDEPDVEMREAGVRGIAACTGKWFRAELDEVTPVTEWPAERASYTAWWASTSGSISKRRAVEQMVLVFGHLRRGRNRLANYALEAMDDSLERTWRAGYALFRALTQQTFGGEQGALGVEERKKITAQARAWVETHADEEN
jgi:tetratricopeptide (TPR) repeat protein